MLSDWFILGLAPMVGASLNLGPLYIVCLIVGGGLLLITSVLGGDVDADGALSTDLDLDLDLDADTDFSATSGFSMAEWFSINFLIFFLAAFGLIGTAMTWMSDVSSVVILVSASVGGLVIGQGAHQIMAWIKRTSGGETVTADDYLNKPARVTVAIEQGRRGEVALKVRSRERFTSASAKHDDGAFTVGQQVFVVDYTNGVAQVVSESEYDFINAP